MKETRKGLNYAWLSPSSKQAPVWHYLSSDTKNSGTKCIIINNKYNCNNLFNCLMCHLNCCSTSSKQTIMSWMKLEDRRKIAVEDSRAHTGKFTQLHIVATLLSHNPSINQSKTYPSLLAFLPPSYQVGRLQPRSGGRRHSQRS